MKTFREGIFNSTIRRYQERKTVVGSFQPFRRDIYKNRFLDPHEEMRQNWEAYMYNSFVNAALNTLARFITGNEIKVVSEDERTSEFLQTFLDDRNFEWQMLDVILKTLICGNGYMELDYDESTGVPVAFYSIADPSRMYVNFDKYGNAKRDEEAFLQRVDPIYNEPDARWYELSYHIGYSYHKIRIKAIPIHEKKIVHFKLNQSINGVYGRANITSSVNDNEMLQEMEKALAMIIKFRAVPKKIIQYGDKDMPVTGEEIDALQVYLDKLEMEENAIVNKPFKMEDLSFSGKDINIDYMIKHTRKKIIAGTAPEFLLGLGDEVNRATAHEQLVAFILSVMSDRKIFTTQIENRVLKPLIKHYGLNEDTHVEFGNLDFESEAEKTTRLSGLWSSNAITLNEMRKELSLEQVEGGDVYFATWVAQHGLEQKPTAGMPAGVIVPKDANSDFDFGKEPIFQPNSEPGVAGISFSESFDPSGTRVIADKYCQKMRVVYEQAKDEVLRHLERFKEGFMGDKITNLMEVLPELLENHIKGLTQDAYVKGFSEAAKKVEVKRINIKQTVLQNLEDEQFKKISTLHKKEKDKLQDLMTSHIEEKKSLSSLSKKIASRFDLTRYEAERIARTEVVRLYAEGTKDAIVESNITNKYEWVTSKGACKNCNSLNGKVFDARKKVSESFENVSTEKVALPVTSTHPNCKCSIVPHIKI